MLVCVYVFMSTCGCVSVFKCVCMFAHARMCACACSRDHVCGPGCARMSLCVRVCSYDRVCVCACARVVRACVLVPPPHQLLTVAPARALEVGRPPPGGPSQPPMTSPCAAKFDVCKHAVSNSRSCVWKRERTPRKISRVLVYCSRSTQWGVLLRPE